MKQGISLGFLTFINLTLAFIFQWYVIYHYGAGSETDAFFAAFAIPQIALAVISSSLMQVLIPMFAGENDEKLKNDSWSVIYMLVLFFGLLSFALFISTKWWVPYMVPGFNIEITNLTIDLTKILLLTMVFSAVNSVQYSVYHAKNKFYSVEFAQTLAGVVSILLLYLLMPRYGIKSAAWIALFRAVFQVILMVPVMGRPRKPENIGLMISLIMCRVKPLIIGTSYYKTDPIVDRYLISSASSGSMTLFYLAQQLYGAVMQVIGKAVSAPLFPNLSMAYKSGRINDFRRTYYKIIRNLLVLSISAYIVMLLLGQFFLGLMVGYGNISGDDVFKLWIIMALLGGYFIGGIVGQFCASAFYACGDTNTPTKMSVITFTAYLPLKVLAYINFGLTGLAITTSVYYLINMFLLIYLFKIKI